MIKSFICCIIGLFCLIGTFLLPQIEYKYRSATTCPYANTSQKIIAHAGGAIDGITYTNSLEAVINSLNKGIRFIELDLLETADGKLIAAHDWKRLYRALDIPFSGTPVPLALNDIIHRRLYGKYTPLDGPRIVQLFEQYPDAVLVTDKTQNIDLLKSTFKTILPRIIVETTTLSKYKYAVRSGLYSVYSLKDTENLIFPKQFRGGIIGVTLSRRVLERDRGSAAKRQASGLCQFVYTIKNLESVSEADKELVTLFYSDEL